MNKLKTATLITIIQMFFLALTLFYFFMFEPNRDYLLIGILVISILTIVFRTGFCGWICPIGTTFVLIRKLGKLIGSISFIRPINKQYKQWINKHNKSLKIIDKYARYFKYIFLIWMVLFGFIVEGDQHGMINSTLLIAFLVILGLFVDRSFCKYLCPLGATLGLFSKISPTKVTRNEELCINCDMCTNVCPMQIDVSNKKYVNDTDCNSCLICVDTCPVNNALNMKVRTMKIPKNLYGVIIASILLLVLIIANLIRIL